jgi:hypothetical protein
MPCLRESGDEPAYRSTVSVKYADIGRTFLGNAGSPQTLTRDCATLLACLLLCEINTEINCVPTLRTEEDESGETKLEAFVIPILPF